MAGSDVRPAGTKLRKSTIRVRRNALAITARITIALRKRRRLINCGCAREKGGWGDEGRNRDRLSARRDSAAVRDYQHTSSNRITSRIFRSVSRREETARVGDGRKSWDAKGG